MLCAAELIVGETGTVVSGKWLDPFGIGGLTLRISISPVSYRLRNSTCNAAAGVTSDTSGCLCYNVCLNTTWGFASCSSLKNSGVLIASRIPSISTPGPSTGS